MRRTVAAALLALSLWTSAATAAAQSTEGTPEASPEPGEGQSPAPEDEGEIWEGYWFWLALSSVVLGITTAIIVDVTTDDPAPSDPMDPGMGMMGLTLRF